MLTITTRSAVTGTVNTMDVNVDNIHLWTWGTGTPLAEAAPHLTAAERRFPEEDAAALQEALESRLGQLATKTALAEVRTDVATAIADVRKALTHVKWMIATTWALTLLILGTLLLFK